MYLIRPPEGGLIKLWSKSVTFADNFQLSSQSFKIHYSTTLPQCLHFLASKRISSRQSGHWSNWTLLLWCNRLLACCGRYSLTLLLLQELQTLVFRLRSQYKIPTGKKSKSKTINTKTLPLLLVAPTCPQTWHSTVWLRINAPTEF